MQRSCREVGAEPEPVLGVAARFGDAPRRVAGVVRAGLDGIAERQLVVTAQLAQEVDDGQHGHLR